MPTVADLSEGALFGSDFRIVRQLAQGGMGAVYVVQQLSTGKSRALKLMRPELAQDEEARRRFVLEAQVGSRIQSEHVVDVLSAGVDEATQVPYLVMELLEGEDLATRIERAGPLSVDEVRELFEQLCHAVGEAHTAGIVHRDLKPANIFLARSRRAGESGRTDVKVLDFGIARLVAESATRAPTMGMIGTPLWMAPEQTEKGNLTPAADVWALGLILYYCLTGHNYWRSGQDPEATFSMVLKEMLVGPLPTPSLRARDDRCAERVPPQIDPVFARAVARPPAERYPDANAFWAALRGALANPSSERALGARPAPSSSRLEIEATTREGDRGAVPGPPVLAPRPLFEHATPTSPFPWWTIPVGLVVLTITVGTCLKITRGTASKTPSPVAQPILPAAPVTPWAPGGAKTSAAPCRLCTVEVAIKRGPLTREAVIAAVEANFPRIDSQCLTTSGRLRRKGGAMTLSFVIRGGQVSSRAIARSTVPDETDRCVSAAMSEVIFPAVSDESEVLYTLKFDPMMR